MNQTREDDTKAAAELDEHSEKHSTQDIIDKKLLINDILSQFANEDKEASLLIGDIFKNLLDNEHSIIDFVEEALKECTEEEILEYCAEEVKEFEAMTGTKYKDIAKDMEHFDSTDESKKEAYYNRLRDYMKYSFTMGWDIKSKALKKITYHIFDYFGIEMPEGIDKVEEKKISKYEGLTFYKERNRAKYCQNYVIEGDEYFYDYYRESNLFRMTHCLSIGTSSFYPVEQNMDFKYDIYMKYLDKHFDVLESKPLLFAPESFGATNLEIIESVWEHSIPDKDKKSINAIWKSFKDYKTRIYPRYFAQRSKQARLIENNISSYTILTFSQFQQIYGFLSAYKIETGKSWVSSNKHKGNVINHIWMVCKFNIKCTRKVYYLVDSLHQIVFIKFYGTHHATCEQENKKHCYPAFRNLYLHGSGHDPIKVTKYLKREYRDCYEYVIALGEEPTTKIFTRWVMKNFEFLDKSVYNPSLMSDYRYCVELMKKSSDSDVMLTMKYNKYCELGMDGDNILHYFIYDNQKDLKNVTTDDFPGLIFSFKPLLEKLISSKDISCDVTFDLIRDKNVKFVTLCYKVDTLDGKEPHNFLGCIGTLPLMESNHNF